MVGTTISHYTIIEELGRGGMGVVYKAIDTSLDREVALKFLTSEMSSDPVSKARFIQEAKAASSLDHPNICTIYEIGEAEDGRLFIAMSYYDGQTLRTLIEDGALAPEQAASIASQVADGLHKSHSANIVHRDIKPANIIVTPEGRVKILDFGLAKLEEVSDLTRKGSTLGTAAYMSPEQVRGETVDAGADLWSLGALIYEMLSGRKAFGGEYEQAILYSVLNEAPAPLSDDIPDGLVRIVDRLLEKDPVDRFSEATKVVEALELFTVSKIARTTVNHASSNPALISNRMATIAGAILFIAVTIWAYTNLGGHNDPPIAPRRDAVAVLPFKIQGDESDKSFGEGMVTLLSHQLDGSGSLRAIDPNALLGYITRHPDLIIDPQGGREVANEFGADRYILGAIVSTGDRRIINATLYEGESVKVSEASVSYTEGEEFFSAFDDLTIQLLGHLIDQRVAEYWLESVRMTDTYPAVKALMKAFESIRKAEYAEGLAAAQAAVEADSSFVLGWVAVMTAGGWLAQHDVVNEAVQKIRDLSDRIPERFLPYFLAVESFTAGQTQDAVAILEELLSQYPEDISANGHLAEYIYHSENQGFSLRRSLASFELVQKYDPGNQEYASHLFELYARFDEWEKQDSLVNSWDVDQMPELRDAHRLLTGDSTFQNAMLDRYSSLPVQPGRTLYSLLLYIGRYDLAQSLLERLISNEDGPAKTRLQLLLSVTLAAQGQMTAFNDVLSTLHAENSARALQIGFFEAIMPIRSVDMDRLREIETAVISWDTLSAPLTNPYEQNNHAVVKAYMKGMLRWKMGDPEGLRNQRDVILATFGRGNPSLLPGSLERELSALLDWSENGAASAIEILAEAIPRDQYYLVARSIFLGRPTINWLMSELLLDSGREEEAVPWMETYGSNAFSFVWSGPSQLRQAEIYDRLGDFDEAIRLYERVVEQWRNADPEFLPQIREARDRLNTLLDLRAREPN